MSFSKIALLSGAAAFVSSAALAGGHNIPLRASAVAGAHKVTASHKQVVDSEPAGAPKCGTGFGTPTATPDGIIAWNDTSGTTFDTGGGADFTCAAKTKIKKVYVRGYFGAAQEQFNVTFYANDSANGSDEPNDSKVVCSYTGLLGAAGGQYPTDVTTKLKLTTPCKLKKGKYWVAVQNNDSAGPWYWMVQNATGGSTNADWIDRHGVFTTACTTFDNDAYLVNCLGYTYPDWMLELH
jgi:hypothetical protein